MYWLAPVAVLLVAAIALVRPEAILVIRARIRPPQEPDPTKTGRVRSFGPREVRICGVVLLIIGVALVRTLMQ